MNKNPIPAGSRPLCRRRGFTLFEVMVALAVFVLAALGIMQAIQGTIDVALLARDRMRMRAALESRLAFCLVQPPRPGTKRVIGPGEPGGVRIEETLSPCQAKNAEGHSLTNLFQLTLLASQRISGQDETEKVSLVIYHPEPLSEEAAP